ncbi:MAG TPA: hypothetical protein DGZ24_01185 [Rhodospirillaceae bacterium]|nr:hypothetical protein [Rhodospirillaceae bacterium]|tara:strand:- start:3248 stop:3997 length:750 start_codon:yes stop_codon:yes gene_type:complete
MAYNNLSGSLISPLVLAPPPDGTVHILSGNLSTSDGSAILNIPRVSNATNNALITNVGGDANDITCETNLTFDGSVLTVTGELTASIGVSASIFYGDGSRLTGIAGGGSGGGIFSQISNTKAYTTSSIQVGSSATPNHTLSVAGASYLNGSVIHKRTTTTDDYTISTTDYYVCADTSGGALKLTLPQASTTTSGQTFIIKDEGGAAGSNPITVSGSASDTIDGQNLIVLESPYTAIHLYCNGNNKYFIC